MDIKSADIFLTQGTSWISKAIRFFSTNIGEKRAKVNHVGVVIEEGNLKTCVVVEALSKVKEHSLWSQYGPKNKDKVAIFRPINLSEEEKEKITNYAKDQVGRKYGFGKIVAHLLDWTLQGAYVFRRFTKKGKYPICSWLVAHAFKEVDKDFGVKASAAQPDDIWDFVMHEDNQDKYECIHELKRIW